MLSLNNISYKVDGNYLLQNITINFEPQKLNLIIGPNGAGKSTLIKIICNQLKPYSDGTVLFDKKNIKEISITELAKVRSVLSQNVELAFPLTVAEIVMMGRYPHFNGKPNKQDIVACKEAMDFFDISDFADRNYLTLSGGEKQRVNFARVIAQIWYPIKDSYRYLILDEPLTFLDIHYQYSLMNKLVELLKNKDIIIVGVVHDLNLAAKFADCILLLNQGKILASGNKYEVLTTENIKTAYFLDSTIHFENNTMHLFFK